MTKRALRSIVLALPLAVLVVGAADNIDLPAPLQRAASLLDIAIYFPTWVESANQTSLFEHWVLPINAAFYAFVLFGLLSVVAHRRKSGLPAAPGPSDSALSTDTIAEDPNFPYLANVLDAKELREEFRQHSIPAWEGLEELRVNVLKWHWTKRRTFEVVFRGHLLGKVYPTDRHDVYEYMESLKQAGFDREAEFSIPQPIAYLPSLRLLLQERVVGQPAKDIFLSGDERQRAEVAERCALWLARFHAVAPRLGLVAALKEELSRMQGWTDCLVRMGEPFASRAGLLFQQLEAAASTLGPGELCAGHGSYSPEHVILIKNRTVTIDWDDYDVGEPGRDVARFIVAVQRLALGRLKSIRALDAVVEAFQRTYLEAGRPEVASRLGFFRAAMCLQLAMYCVFHHPDKPGQKKASAMLDEGLRIIEQFRRGE
jgi:aminoglycoside phosphotransferase (APT) family kinase protein